MATTRGPLSNIDHFVVLMLENRSFDHMLGFLYPGGKSAAGDPFDGLTGKESNPDAKGKPVKVFPITSEMPHPYFWPGDDPGEGFYNTNQQLFGSTQPAANTKATNSGFVVNFGETLPYDAKTQRPPLPGTTANDVMACYTPKLLPVLSALAKGFAVSDRWFSSAPTETLPNRAFVQMATSQGHLSDSTTSYTSPSIYPSLEKAGATWAIYGYNALPLTKNNLEDIRLAPASHFGEWSDFAAAVKNGTLANYVFLEPSWGSSGNSQHPNYDVSLGEQFMLQLYQTLRASSLWNKTLLIITYDEHGGLYDHVPPPTNAATPDNSVGQYNFDFKRFGVRVPAVFISPWIDAGRVFRAPGATPFDHTSILKTLETRFGMKPLTARDAAAPDLSSILTRKTPRTDDPMKGVVAPKSSGSPIRSKAPSHLEHVYAQSAADAPVVGEHHHAVVHREDMPQFKTGKDAMAWGEARTKAAAAKQPARKKR